MRLPSKKTIIRLLLFVASTVVIFYSFPRVDEKQYDYEENKPWRYSLLTAPFDIPVHLDSLSARIVKDSIDASFVPVYKRLSGVEKSSVATYRQSLDTVSGLVPTDRQKLVASLERVYRDGVVSAATRSRIQAGKLPKVRFITGKVAKTTSTGSFRSEKEAYAYIDSLFRYQRAREGVSSSLLASVLTPNVVVDTLRTGQYYDDAYQRAMAPIGVVQTGERIIDRGEKVTPQIFTVLQTYEEMLKERKMGGLEHQIYPLAGQLLYILILLSALYCYLFFFRKELFDNMRAMTFIMLMIVGFAAFAFVMKISFADGLYMVPYTMIPIMILVYFDSRTALFCLIIEAMICSGIADDAFQFIFVQFVAGVTAIYSLKELTRRSQLVRTALMVFFSYGFSYVAIEVIGSGSIEGVAPHMFAAFGVNAVLISFAYVLIFVFEKLFGFTSMVTLVELSDINNPVLRELSEECPGTFQHSMSVSSLASEAAVKIGANALLVRAGALYHDIGKIKNPAFFTENQYGVNPHDALSPEQSARIVISHVADGLKRADKENLPSVIRDFIAEHHGAGKAKYFYNTYCNAHPDEMVDETPFTYPGPNPRSRETSILMMADAVEAASRSLTEHSAEAISSLVNRLIDGQIADGLHNDSPLSFKDVRDIKESFISRLRTIYHSRIAYPKEQTKNNNEKS